MTTRPATSDFPARFSSRGRVRSGGGCGRSAGPGGCRIMHRRRPFDSATAAYGSGVRPPEPDIIAGAGTLACTRIFGGN